MRTFLVAAAFALMAGGAPAQPADPNHPCHLTYDETASRNQLQASMTEKPSRGDTAGLLANGLISGCSVWTLEIDGAGQVRGAVYVRGQISDQSYIREMARWLSQMKFLRFSGPWSGTWYVVVDPTDPLIVTVGG